MSATGMRLHTHNFSAGPAVLPEPVLDRIAAELHDWRGTGASVLETSHRSAAFVECAADAETRLRRLLAIPDDYAVLFLQGGATLQFSSAVMNLAGKGSVAIADTGSWSAKAYAAAKRLAPTTRACSLATDADGQLYIPQVDTWSVPQDVAYLHLCDNETIGGVALDDALLDEIDARFTSLPLVIDMSSSILSRTIDVSRYAVIYAGAQKNLGPAGLTLVIASPEAMMRSRRVPELPSVLSWAAMADADSMLNTPPTFAWYSAGLVLEWIEEQGGPAAMEKRNRDQAKRVYSAIDASDIYVNSVAGRHRSIMNVPFSLFDESLTEAFLAEAAVAGLIGLKGHKSQGGCRASLYNALPEHSIDALLAHLERFARVAESQRADS